MRRLLGMLRADGEPPAHAPQPTLEELVQLVSQVREAGLSVELTIEGEPTALPLGVGVSAYRIVQEALTNVLKHAGPASARVVVRYRNRELELEVADDGRGPRTEEISVMDSWECVSEWRCTAATSPQAPATAAVSSFAQGFLSRR